MCRKILIFKSSTENSRANIFWNLNCSSSQSALIYEFLGWTARHCFKAGLDLCSDLSVTVESKDYNPEANFDSRHFRILKFQSRDFFLKKRREFFKYLVNLKELVLYRYESNNWEASPSFSMTIFLPIKCFIKHKM